MAPRKNPTGPAVSLVAIAFRKQPELLRELRAAGGAPSLDFASRLLSEWTGKPYSQIRSGALATLSTHVRNGFRSPIAAFAWLAKTDRRLCVWVMLQMFETAWADLRSRERKDVEKAVAITKRWLDVRRVDAAERAELESVLDLATETYAPVPRSRRSSPAALERRRSRAYLVLAASMISMVDKSSDHDAVAREFASNLAESTDVPAAEVVGRMADAISDLPEWA